MAFDLEAAGGYGTGALGDVTLESGVQINSYARVTKITSTSITIGTASNGAYEKFVAGTEVLIHVSAAKSSTATAYLGAWAVATITSVSGSVCTLSKDITSRIPATATSSYYVQAITIPQFAECKFNNVTISPPAYSTSTYYGGIIALKTHRFENVTGTANKLGIDLTDKGIPTDHPELRPLTAQEEQGTLDTDQYSGWENHITERRLLLNCGDGAAFIVVEKFLINSSNLRIGNLKCQSYKFYRGAEDSVTAPGTSAPTGVTNIGGSSVLFAGGPFSNSYTVERVMKMMAKYRDATLPEGKGLARWYIAGNGNPLRNDEGLYAYDVISDKTRVKSTLGIKSFGNGELGTVTANANTVFNCYAAVTAMSSNRKTLTYSDKTNAGLGKIQAGSLVMIHTLHKTTATSTDSGTFVMAKVLSDDGTQLTIDTAAPNLSLNNYYFQIIGVPQFENLTLKVLNNKRVGVSADGKGGVCAVAVSDTFNLEGGKLIDGSSSGLSTPTLHGHSTVPYGRAGLAAIGNAQDCNKLPVGQGAASFFVLARTLKLNTSSRIGGYTDGALFGGQVDRQLSGRGTKGGGYSGVNYSDSVLGGNGAGSDITTDGDAGYGSGDRQGAHIMIIADTITGFNMSAISTGGYSASPYHGHYAGAGYGSAGPLWRSNLGEGCGGGYNGAGGAITDDNGTYAHGSSSGWAFIYCNHATDVDTTGIVI